jgi:CRISPR-associated protein Cmr5
MKNLDQLRARTALRDSKGLNRSAISKLPGLILSNGLLSAAAFCEAEGGGDNRNHLKAAMRGIAKHLSNLRIASTDVCEVKSLIDDLAGKDSITLQRATAESLSYLSYLKRFAEKD